MNRPSARLAPVDEAMRMVETYRDRYPGWNARHFYGRYRADGGQRSYTWVKNTLQQAGAIPRGKKRGPHRKRRQPAPYPGMMLHQDASTHQWVPGQHWDLVVTMDDATNEHYSMSSPGARNNRATTSMWSRQKAENTASA